jgi:hypothetical protein
MIVRGEPPKTASRSWIDGGSSVFGVAGLIAAPCVSIFMMFDRPLLLGFRSFLVLIFAFQAACGNNFNRTICS